MKADKCASRFKLPIFVIFEKQPRSQLMNQVAMCLKRVAIRVWVLEDVYNIDRDGAVVKLTSHLQSINNGCAKGRLSTPYISRAGQGVIS